MGSRSSVSAFAVLALVVAGCALPNRGEMGPEVNPGYDDGEPARIGDPYPESPRSLRLWWEPEPDPPLADELPADGELPEIEELRPR